MVVYRAARPGRDPLDPSRPEFCAPRRAVVCVAPTVEEAVRWAKRAGVRSPVVWALRVPRVYAVDVEGNLVPLPEGKWIEWGEGLREAFVPPEEVEEVEKITKER